MDPIMNFINQFRAEETSRLDTLDKSRKPGLVLALEDCTDDERVIDFFLSVGSDESEYDLARIEVFKVFEVKEFADPDVRRRVGRMIREVLSHSHDDDVRNYAAMAAAS